jgi:hypothetical protein
MAYVNPFMPDYGTNQVVTPAVASASVDIDPKAFCVRLVNTGSNVCYVKVGAGTVVASTADVAVRAGSELIIKKALGDSILAYISAAGTTLNIQTGNGGV